MAESAAAATAAPSGGPGTKGGSSSAWWKSLTNRKKPKEAPASAAGAAQPPAEPLEMPYAPPCPSDFQENQQPNSGSGSRRNLKISRSGRFKEKRKVRATLLAESPQKLFQGSGEDSSTSATSTHPGEETPCQ